MSFTINVFNGNIGSFNDWELLVARNQLQQEEGIQLNPSLASPEKKEKFFKKLTDLTGQHNFKDKVVEAHNQIVKDKLQAVLNQFQPDIFCLQEYFDPNLNHLYGVFDDILNAADYKLIRCPDLAIAYKKSDYEQIASGYLTFDPENNLLYNKNIGVSPALYIDLRHKESKAVVRVVTDHVAGFDAVKQKEATLRRRYYSKKKFTLPNSHQERLDYFLSKLDSKLNSKKAAARGDAALELSLQDIETAKVHYPSSENRLAKIFPWLHRFFKSTKPDLIIYGLDANTTAKYTSKNKNERLHPKRIRLFEKYGYQCDKDDQSPTIRDGNSFERSKYDYVFTKPTSKVDQVTIKDRQIEGINHPEMLDQPDQLMSDHLPVLAQINYQRASFIQRFFAAIFSR